MRSEAAANWALMSFSQRQDDQFSLPGVRRRCLGWLSPGHRARTTRRISDLDPLPEFWNTSGEPTGHRGLAGCCLFLDVDGTLVDFAATPAGTRIDGELATLLERL